MAIVESNCNKHWGRKIKSIRLLRGITEMEFGNTLGISVQDVSKLEQLERIEIGRVKDIARALGVTEQGLIDFSDDRVQYNTMNFYENCGVSNSTIANCFHQTVNTNQYDKLAESLELILESLKIYK
ncbi:helix-turn-helix domain-containing protein [Chitinophaga hostae]|uniref:Helix-turn-helix transcriptional regulator n=1 Tax=Chitinophaga hostae TaxID=2831022 RepID=A0ABS5IW59_9BACT|nr:helix-turn-helix transcriptional regulator [Chitinophaga hostae]MBS0027088.1 helix-turn-helix transcriptional regulator [Chitinophaga hostae]